MDVQAEESEFQTSLPCANLIKMKTHFHFILMNWNITSSKMVRKNILEGWAIQEKYPGYGLRNSSLKFVWCVAAEQNNKNKNSDSSHFYWYILIARIESLGSEAQLSAGKEIFQCVSV